MILLLGRGGLFGQHFTKLYPDVIALSRSECDITQQGQVMDALRIYRPDVVINAAGVVPKSPTIHDTFATLQINSLAPRMLAETCSLFGCRLIHLSTSDVFSGALGAYREDDYLSPTDLYGISKAVGEVSQFPHTTIRTSFVGWPDDRGRGLLAWFHNQKYAIGYDRVMWDGVTALELAKIIVEKVVPDTSKTGVIHVHGETVSKYDILQTAKEIWDWQIELVRESDVAVVPHHTDRTIRASRGIHVNKSLKQQLEEMKAIWS